MAVRFLYYDRKGTIMASAPEGFRRRVKDRVAPESRQDIPFFIETLDEDEEGNEFVVLRDDYVARQPSEEELLALFVEGGREHATMADEVGAMFDLFRAVLKPSDFKRLYSRFKDPKDLDVDFELIGEIFKMLMEKWQDFPTTQPGVSSASRATTGTKSGGRAPGKGSIRSKGH